MRNLKIDLESFVWDFIDAAQEITFGRNPISLYTFEHELAENLSSKLNVPEGVIRYLYSPFHHIFFNDRVDPKKHGTVSPFQLLNSGPSWESYNVQSNFFNDSEKLFLFYRVLEEHSKKFSNKDRNI